MEKDYYITDNKKCTGCSACANICPKGCISMLSDSEGFIRPNIDAEKCIDCGLCRRKCPVNMRQDRNKSQFDITAYAAYSKDENIRLESSSGGLFTEIALYVLDNGGVVFGATFDDNLNVRHISVERKEDLKKLRGAKYVQSKIGDTFIQVHKYLMQGKTVLFTGTPCQISGLYSFLNKDYDNLITQDFICHGVPSPLIWSEYVKYREAKAGSKTSKMFFRNKKDGWKSYSVQFEFLNGAEYIQTNSEDLYMRSFLRNICLRPSCYQCRFKSKTRQSDITLADFWGIDKVIPQMDDDKGISLLILNSEKGCRIFENIKEKLEYSQTDYETSVKYNSAISESAIPDSNRDAFMRCVTEKGFSSAAKKYLKIPIKSRIKRLIKSLLKKAIRR